MRFTTNSEITKTLSVVAVASVFLLAISFAYAQNTHVKISRPVSKEVLKISYGNWTVNEHLLFDYC